jgi:hypothetical protein
MHKVLGGGERRLVGETAICEWLNKTVIVYSAHKVLGGGKRRLVGETAICEPVDPASSRMLVSEINLHTARLRMAHLISYSLFNGQSLYGFG